VVVRLRCTQAGWVSVPFYASAVVCFMPRETWAGADLISWPFNFKPANQLNRRLDPLL